MNLVQYCFEWFERASYNITINFRDLPAYHWMTDDARQEGLAKGRKESLNEDLKRGREENLKERAKKKKRAEFD